MSATVIQNFAAAGGVGNVTFTWSYTDPYASGSKALRHRAFIFERSLSADFSVVEQNAAVVSPFIAPTPAGVTLYGRVRSQNEAGINGPWYGPVSAAEASGGLEDVWGGSWSSFTPTGVSEGGSLTVTSVVGRYKQSGTLIAFTANLTISSVSSPTGYFRVGSVPLPMRSGGRFSVVGDTIPSAGSSVMLCGEVVDLGSGNTGVKLYKHDGTFAVGLNHIVTVSGFFETTTP